MSALFLYIDEAARSVEQMPDNVKTGLLFLGIFILTLFLSIPRGDDD